MDKTETCGFQMMCDSSGAGYVTTTTYEVPERRQSQGSPLVALILGGGIIGIVGISLYLQATGKIKPSPVYYTQPYYPPPPPHGPGVTFNF